MMNEREVKWILTFVALGVSAPLVSYVAIQADDPLFLVIYLIPAALLILLTHYAED